MDTINIDDFDSPEELFLAAGKLVESQLEILKDLKRLDADNDMVVFIAPLEALLHSFVVLHNISELTCQLTAKGALDFNQAQAYFVKVTQPAAHIITEYNERQRRLAGKTGI